MSITFSKDTVDTLKKLYEVNQGLKIVANEKTLKSKSTDSTALVHASITETVPRDFYIYDLREFLSVLSIIDNPELDFSNNKLITIKSSDGKQKIRYLEADPQFVTSYIDKVPNIGDPDLVVSVSAEEFASVMKAAATLRLEYVGFISDGETIKLTAFNKQNGDDTVTNNFSIEKMTDGGYETFSMFYQLNSNNLNVLAGEGDLEFEISKKKISKITTNNNKTFWLAMNINSKWGE